MPYEIEATATSGADAEAVFKHLCVAEAWGRWGAFPTRPRRERPGYEVPNGVGAIRRIPPAREQVVVFDPPRHYAYVAVAGVPLRGYRADVTLEPAGTGTLIRWQGTFEAKIPGSGPLLRAALQQMLRSFARRVARHSERCEPGCPARLPTDL
ncbi:SRPBCC family protein [Spirillospora sp. NBC_01491]|uniref:SRPBCC family protein n=1 Tax=Spirillospora sp. NBC_01491 TaxID=2976007 RepID=UPI002E381FE4|nr:SRPBCC family protein [Spirillospora sp. NBC_01491]